MYQRNLVTKLCLLLLSGTLASCSSIKLEPQAQNVQIAVGSVPKGCVLRGDVDGVTHDAPIASHKSIETTQSIALRNQASKLGANVIFVTTHKTAYYPQFIVSLGDWVPELDTHTVDGKAYYCSSSALNQMKHKGLSHVSEVETVTKNW
jgi:hypothetical protein